MQSKHVVDYRKKKKEIMINISNVKNYMVIMIENPIEWEVDISKLGRYTSKDDRLSHGYGVSNIIDEVRLCEGNYNFCADDGKFSVSIAIKNKYHSLQKKYRSFLRC